MQEWLALLSHAIGWATPVFAGLILAWMSVAQRSWRWVFHAVHYASSPLSGLFSFVLSWKLFQLGELTPPPIGFLLGYLLCLLVVWTSYPAALAAFKARRERSLARANAQPA